MAATPHDSSSSEYSSSSSSAAAPYATPSDSPDHDNVVRYSPAPRDQYSDEERAYCDDDYDDRPQRQSTHPDAIYAYRQHTAVEPEYTHSRPQSNEDDPLTDYDDMDDANGAHPRHRENEEEDNGAVTQSESEDEAVAQPSDGGETEDESDESTPFPSSLPNNTRPVKQEAHGPSRVKRPIQRVIYHPIVQKASKMCTAAGCEPSVLAYARLLGAGKGTVDFFIREHAITVGRWGCGSDCQIKSEASTISRTHAKLFWDFTLSHWLVKCLAMKNGMTVDGAPVDCGDVVPLNNKSLIEIGDAAFYFLAAAGNTICVNDLKLLGQQILQARLAEENAPYYEETNGVEDHCEQDEIQPARKSKPKERPSKKGKASDGKKSKPPARKGMKTPLTPKPEESSSEDSSESEEGEQVVPDVLDDPKYKLPLLQPSTKKRKASSDRGSGGGSKKRRKKDHMYDEDESAFDSGKFTEEWNKKEKMDFTRALFAVGVDAVYDAEGNVSHFVWDSFRGIAEFPKKTDKMLEEHYRRVMADVRALLDEEEREKKAKGPRNRHKPGCECSVCINTRRSGKKRREEEAPDERAAGNTDGEEGDGRGVTTKSKNRLVGLVTAQKLRVRLSIHEAARRVDTEAGDTVFLKLESQAPAALKELPDWWQPGVHDKDLMRGCAEHGVGQWNKIWKDEYLESFLNEQYRCEETGEELVWPTPQATMKRVREVASAITSEVKRLAKRDALEEKKQRKLARKKEKKMAKRISREGRESGTSKQKQRPSKRNTGERTQPVNDNLEESVRSADQKDYNYTYGGESTAEDSGSERQQNIVVDWADEIETEDDDDDDDGDVKVEVDEEMEVEEEVEVEESGNEGSSYRMREEIATEAGSRAESPHRRWADGYAGYGSGAETSSDSRSV